MGNSEPGTTFRGLPLTTEQDSEIRHYIHVCERDGMPWDTPELQAILADMLSPPELSEEDSGSLDASTTAEQITARNEDDPDGQALAPGHDWHGRRRF